MLKSKLTLLFVLLLAKFAMAQDCDCKKNYQWMKKTFAENDAGFPEVLRKKGIDAYNYHSKSIENRVYKIRDYDDCKKALEDWLRFFRTDHFRLTKTKATLDKQHKAQLYSPISIANEIDLALFKDQVALLPTRSLVGLWETGGNTFAVQKINNHFVASLVEDNGTWKKGTILFSLGENLKEGTRYMSTYRPVPIEKVNYLDDNLLTVNELTLKRVFPESHLKSNEDEFFRLKNSGETFGYKRNEKTVYVRIPSFSFNKKAVDSLLTSLDDVIKSTPNLIIDLRDCQGGQDNNFAKLVPYLYSGATRTVLMEVLSTPRNNEIWNTLINNPDTDDDEKESYQAIQSLLNKHVGEFVNIYGKTVVEAKNGKVLPYPQNIGVIVHENNFSTTEQFLLLAKQSRKVKLFGRKTGGALDVSNMIEATSPTGDFVFEYCISRSLRIPEMEVDDMGIHPDFYLDKSIGEHKWVDFVSDRLNEWN